MNGRMETKQICRFFSSDESYLIRNFNFFYYFYSSFSGCGLPAVSFQPDWL